VAESENGSGQIWERLFGSYVHCLAYRRGALWRQARPTRYRAKALECEERAERTRDPFIKQQLMEIAEKWRTMAAYDEKYAR
jgi:hypothetical protein